MEEETGVEGQRRRSKDRRLDRKSRLVLEFSEERGWEIFKGVVSGG